MIALSRIQAAITAAIFLVALLAFGIQTARIEGFKVWPISVKGYKAKNAELSKQLHDLSTAKNEQKVVTGGNLVKAESGRVKAEGVAKRIESAPVAAGCKTPSEILQADL